MTIRDLHDENEREAARVYMRKLGQRLGFDYDRMVAAYPGGPEAYERMMHGTVTPDDQAAWDNWEREQQALAEAARAKKDAAQRAYRAQRKRQQRGA